MGPRANKHAEPDPVMLTYWFHFQPVDVALNDLAGIKLERGGTVHVSRNDLRLRVLIGAAPKVLNQSTRGQAFYRVTCILCGLG